MSPALRKRSVACVPLLALLCACQGNRPAPMPTVEHVDLQRFMGAWYVIASIPTAIEREAYDAVETYTLQPDGSIGTVFTFRKGSSGGPPKRYTPKGFVLDQQSNALWGMQFVWPVKADYRIIHLSPDYSLTVIGRQKRDYVWIMARTPQIPESEYQRLLQFVAEQGYDPARLRRVPHGASP
ncbi:MAG: Outer rane lipoprotein Blc [Pseudomonadota bacterium]